MVAMVMLLVAMLVAMVIGLLYHPLDHFAAVPIFQFDFLGTVFLGILLSYSHLFPRPVIDIVRGLH